MKKLFEKKEKEVDEVINTLVSEDDKIVLEHLVKKGKKDKVIDRIEFSIQEAKILIDSFQKAVSSLGEEPDLIATL